MKNSCVVLGPPRCGNHMIMTILMALGMVEHHPKINKSNYPNYLFQKLKKNNHFVFGGHPQYPLTKDNFIKSGFRGIYITRDPRDSTISWYFFIMKSKKQKFQWLKKYTKEEGINAMIRGVKKRSFAGVVKRYKSRNGWKVCPNVLWVKYEDLLRNPQREVDLIATHLGIKNRPFKKEFLFDKHRWEFRQGEIGNWKKHFTENNIKTFKEVTKNLLEEEGYTW